MTKAAKGILITRPKAQIDAFAQKLSALGYKPVLAPMIEIEPIKIPMETVQNLTCPTHLIITSQNALLHSSDDLLSQLRPSPKVWVMGPSSSNLAKSLGFKIAKEPERGNTSEELVATILSKDSKDKIQKNNETNSNNQVDTTKEIDATLNPHFQKEETIMILGGQGGRDAIETLFNAEGVKILRIDTYAQHCPNVQYNWMQWQGNVNLALFTSLATLRNAMTLLGDRGTLWLKSIKILVVSNRIKDYAISQGFKSEQVFLSDSASDEDCLSKIQALDHIF